MVFSTKSFHRTTNSIIMKSLKIILVLVMLVGCNTGGDETSTEVSMEEGKKPAAYNLNGEPLYAPELPPETKARLEANLDSARVNYENDPEDEMNIIWYGRRLAYLYRYEEAIEVFSKGLEIHPESFKLYRHRGHRYISTRQFDKAIDDLKKAVWFMAGKDLMIEPDGAPNKLNIPLSTTQFNIYYHLALAHYLKRDYTRAYDVYKECMKVSNNDDLIVATADWLYMTCRKLRRNEEAEELLEIITPEMEIIENASYHNRLLMYKNLKTPTELLDVSNPEDPDNAVTIATQGYGVGNWYLSTGNRDKAKEIFEMVVGGSSWSAFGYIAAEVELKRMKRRIEI